MLEQWKADQLLSSAKIYSESTIIDVGPGTDAEYQLEDADGYEFFLLDVRRSRRNHQKLRLQLRYSRSVVLARLCMTVPHQNPDGQLLRPPHYHSYRENYEDKWAEEVGPFADLHAAVEFFCGKINLPVPDMQGGLS